jgi:addiction module HigA family antidote
MYHVFISTPGDLQLEQDACREVIGEVNDKQAMPLKILLVSGGFVSTVRSKVSDPPSRTTSGNPATTFRFLKTIGTPGICSGKCSSWQLALRVPATRINDIVNEKRGITADTALRLSRYFGTTAKFWLNLQASYELEIAEHRLGEAVMREVLPRSAASVPL